MKLNTLLKKTSRSLYLSARILPDSIRPAFGIAYLLCRYADTMADTNVLPASRRLYWVEKFPQIVRAENLEKQITLFQELSGSCENPYEKTLLLHLEDCLEGLRRIEPDLKIYIADVVQAVCEGMKLDLQRFPQTKEEGIVALKTQKELLDYCRLMGGKPGFFWGQLIERVTPVMLPKEIFFDMGQHIGDALQIVNILRDLPRDLRHGRCYIPQEDLEKEKLTTRDLMFTKNSIRFAPIKKYWIHLGREKLEQAFDFYAAIPKRQCRLRAAVALPIFWTADTFRKINEAPDLLNPTRRIKISKNVIYATLFASPLFALSNRYFERSLRNKLSFLP